MSNKLKFIKNGRKCTVVLTNETKDQICTTDYRIRVYDSDDDRWEDHATTSSELQPNHSFSKDYHKWSATDWEIIVTGEYCNRI
jgi:hypothetical protein